MADFSNLYNPITNTWVISAPRRAKRPDIAAGVEPVCPFCFKDSGLANNEQELYRVDGHMNGANWLVRVVPNKFPFADIHEVIIHSPDHGKNIGELPIHHTKLVLQTYRQRFWEHAGHGNVYIFHNRGKAAGESLPHPHSQLAVVKRDIQLAIPPADPAFHEDVNLMLDTHLFYLWCPKTSQWPDEVWVMPKRQGVTFGETNDDELDDLAHVLDRLIQIYTVRYAKDFSFNYYISPTANWYLRLIPRKKTIGGFELGTGIFVNTQDPKETMQFLKEHFHNPDHHKIAGEHTAEYHEHV
jgi:UDPglucose--hexose-1-phosphate uridylyltransferase